MKTIKYIAALLTLYGMANPALAGASPWRVTFEDNGKAPEGSVVSVLFLAAGCAKEKRCGNLDKKQLTVCKQALDVKPGETTKYSFNDGTSGRMVLICSNADSTSAFQNDTYKSQTKHTHVCADTDGSWRTYDDQACTKNVGSKW